MNADNDTEDTGDARRTDPIEAYCSGTMGLDKLAEILGVDTLAARDLLQARGIRLHELDIGEASSHGTHEHLPDAEPAVAKGSVAREWTIQTFRVDRWVDDTQQDRPHTFEEMKDALARCELLHSGTPHRGYNHARKKSYEPM